MPIETNLNVPPYGDDFDETKGFARILFRPGVSVQVREMNQLQAILQKQIERFGDNVYKSGTIIDGCNFSFYPSYPYVKIADSEVSGAPSEPANYVGLFARGNTGLTAFIIDYENGYEATDPDLKTLYVNYRDAGADYNTFAFSSGETLTLTDANVSIFTVNINNPGLNFSNNDPLVIVPSVVVSTTSGAFANGDYVTQPSTGANLQIVGVDANTLALDGQTILRLAPRQADMANALANSMSWAVANNDTIRNASNTAAGAIVSVIGSGAMGYVRTDGSGRIIDTVLTAQGLGYTNTPYTTVRSANNAGGIASANLTAQNYYTRIVVANTAQAVGNGYAFGVTEGVIYQKGYFLRCEPQTVLVSKYNQQPNAVSVGFETIERIVDHMQDPSLLDNVIGEENANAPGADRLVLTPQLKVYSSDSVAANSSFFPLAEWSEGVPFRQNQMTAFNKIEDELAIRCQEGQGDFVTDPFLVTTRSPETTTFEGNVVSVAVDPGQAYVSGYRVKTDRNFVIDVPKGLASRRANAQKYALGYGSYVRVKERAGVFQYSTAATVALYSAAKGNISNVSAIEAGNLSPAGSQIGSAQIRMMKLESGTAGDPNAVYRLYMFNIQMSPGRSFRDVRSVYYAGTSKGIADVVLEPDATTAANIAVLKDASNSQLLFSVGAEGFKNANNANYRYRTVDQTLSISNSGIVTKSLSSIPNEFWPYSTSMTSDDLKDVTIIPTGGDMRAAANVTGTVSVSTATNAVVGTGTSFITDLAPGDWVWCYSNAAAFDVHRVVNIANNTYLTVDAVMAFTNTTAGIQRMFPNAVPIPLGTRAGLTGTVDANSNILTINLGMSFLNPTSVNCAIGAQVLRTGVTAGSKQADRGRMVKIRPGNNAGGTQGPWSLGVSDVFRLNGVYVGNSSVNSTAWADVSDQFYVDHGQTPDYLGISTLKLKPKATVQPKANDYILVSFDAFSVTQPGFFCVSSYTSANSAQVADVDSRPLANLGTSIATLEVPEVYSATGREYDLLTQFDFRPIAANTVVTTTTAATAPLNPANTLGFGDTTSPLNDRKFPEPGSMFTSDVEFYRGRVDSVFLAKDGQIFVMSGMPVSNVANAAPPNQPTSTLRLNDVVIPAYPTIPQNMSPTLANVIDTGVANERYVGTRLVDRTARVLLSDSDVDLNQPRGYTMREIGGLERRIENLEYVAALSALQTDMSNRVVPSSVNPALNRFKYGFFVDDFNSAISSDTLNPQYAASIEGGFAYPPRFVWEVYTKPVGVQTPDYCDFLVCDQNNATYPKPLPNVPAPNTDCVPNTFSVPAIITKENSDNGCVLGYTANNTGGGADSSANGGSYPESFTVRMADTGGAATLWFYHYPAGPNKIEIKQGNTVIASTRNAIDLTVADEAFLESNSLPTAWFGPSSGAPRNASATGNTRYPFYWAPFRVINKKDFAGGVDGNRASPHGAWVDGTGKIVFTHNPANGRDYTITVTRGIGSAGWRMALQYPRDTKSITCPPPPVPDPVIYKGTCDMNCRRVIDMPVETSTTSPLYKKVYLGQPITNATDPHKLYKDYRSGSGDDLSEIEYTGWGLAPTGTHTHSFDIECRGLKPNTQHNVTVEGKLRNDTTKPYGKTMGSPLITDSTGFCRFTYFDDEVDVDHKLGLDWNTKHIFDHAGKRLIIISAPNSSGQFDLHTAHD